MFMFEDVDQTLVDTHLEVLATRLVDVRAANDAVPMDTGRQWHRTFDLCLCTDHGLRDLAGRLIDDRVVVSLESDPDPMLVCHVVFSPS